MQARLGAITPTSAGLVRYGVCQSDNGQVISRAVIGVDGTTARLIRGEGQAIGIGMILLEMSRLYPPEAEAEAVKTSRPPGRREVEMKPTRFPAPPRVPSDVDSEPPKPETIKAKGKSKGKAKRGE